ncbi:MAG TPA: hypothetical protein IAB62_06825 [Candidatus Coprocola pullicola]|nr:hypothetical protein [Candidatus Coprocola pullicola]
MYGKRCDKSDGRCLSNTAFSVNHKVQKSFKDAMEAKTEDYEKLKKKYRQYAILPEEFATDFLEY